MRKVLLYISLLVVFSTSHAQQSQTTFGQNRVQYKKFNWKYISTKHFYIYYYFGGAEIAHNAGRIAEKQYDNILSLTGARPDDKITLIMYNCIEDKQQSNIGLEDFRQLGGQTDLFKTKAEIAYPGNMVDFREEVRKSIAEMLVRVYLYGGRFKEMVQSSYLLTLPNWYLPGVASYVGKGWSPEMHDRIKAMLKSKKGIKNPDFITVEDAELVGHSIWNYIAQEFGTSNISNVISLTKALRKVDVAISGSLGISYDAFLSGWRKFYLQEDKGTQDVEEYKISRKKKRVYSDVKFSPSGQYLAYTKNYRGKYGVYVYDLLEEKETKVFKGGQRLVNQELNFDYPRLAWQQEGMLGVIYSKKGIVRLQVIDIEGDADFDDKFERFELVNSFQFSKNGRNILFSGVKKGMADIYIYDLFSKKLNNLTNDLYDDLDPVYTPDGGIIFSSNRLKDTLGVDYGKFNRILDQYDLYYMAKPDTTEVLTNLTDNGYRKISGIKRLDDDKYLVQVENFKKIQLYEFSLKTRELRKVTDFDQNVLRYDYSKTGALSFTMYEGAHQQLYLSKQFDLITQPEGKIEQVVIPEKVKEYLYPSAYDEYAIPKVYKTKIERLDIEDYIFESDSAKLKERKLKKQQEDFEDKVFILGPYSYKKLFGINNVATSLRIDQLRGLGILLEFGMSDLLEDHRVTASIFGLADLRSSSIFAEYKNLKHKLDYTYRYERNTLYFGGLSYLQNYVLNKLTFQVDKPFSFSSRVGALIGYNSARYSEFRLTLPFQERDEIKNYVQLGTEYVFDNTIVQGANMLEGTRMKAYVHTYLHNEKDLRFSKMALDIRNYQKIHKQMIFATRVSYGRYLGNAKKNFLMGGMDNWVFSDRNFSGKDNPLNSVSGVDNSDILFADFATNIRGFDYNERYGNNYFLINAEYRLPIIKYLYPGPISSQFFSNLQLVGFFDMGTAWNGSSLFFSSSDVNVNQVQDIGEPPTFVAQVKDYSDPFIYGYGVGMRSNILGYYMKFDLAWGVENGVTKTPKLYITLGYDF